MNKISIYIPTKNRIGLLKRAVNSVLNQTYDNWELLIVNDASSDGTMEYLDSIRSESIKVFHQKKSEGACVARNLAIEHATGSFITGLDDDDYFDANRLEQFVYAWSKKPETIVLLFTGRKEIDSNEKVTRNVLNAFKIVKRKDLLFANFIGNQIFTTVSNMKQVGGFDPNLKMWQDVECWYRMLALGDAMLVKNETYNHDNSVRPDRITLSTKERLIATFNYFSDKHKLNLLEKITLNCQLTSYGVYRINLFYQIKRVLLAILSGSFIKIYISKLMK